MNAATCATMFSTGKKDDWATPAALFAALHREFNFTLDLAAHAGNHRLPRWIGPGSSIAEDLLTYPIPRDEVCWLNPPYSRRLQAPCIRTVAQAAIEKGVRSVVLIPARTDTRAFHQDIWNASRCQPYPWVREVRFLKGRLRFEGAEASAPFPSMLVVFG